MSRNGSGTYSLPEAPFVYDTVISETAVNSNFSDMAAALTQSLSKDGQTTPSANLPMGGYRHTGVGNGAARNDYAAIGQIQDESVVWCGTAGGTANALALTPTPSISAYATGQRFRFQAGSSPSDDAVTIAISGLDAKATQIDDTALSSSRVIAADKYYECFYDGTVFQISRLFGVDVASLANGTDGELITWDSDGAPATVAAGTSGQILTSNGAGAAPTFQDAANTTDQAAQDLALQALMEIDALSGQLGPRAYGNAVGDAFEDESGIDTTASLNETYDATNDLYSNPAVYSQISTSGKTPIGNLTGNGAGLAAAFDDNLDQAASASAASSTSPNPATIGIDFGASGDVAPDRIVMTSSNNLGFNFSSGGTSNYTIKIQSSDNNSDWSDEGDSQTFANANSTLTRTFDFTPSGAHRYWRAHLTPPGSNNTCVAEMQFFALDAPPDMTLQSKAATIIAAAAPTEIRLQVDIEAVDALTLTGGTPDVVLSASRDGNTTFSTITLDSTTAYSAGQRKLIKGTVDVSGQPSDTDIVVKVVTDNGKEMKIHGWTIQTNQALTVA